MKEESDIQIELSRIISALQSIDGILADPIGKWASLTAAEKELYGNSAASWWQLERIMLHNKANHLRTQQTGLLGLLSSLMEARKVVEADDPIDQLRITNFVSANVTHIPEYHELQSLITRPLKKPFPVSIADYNAVLTSPDVKDLIMESSSTYSKQFMLKIWYPIVSPPTTGDSEDSFHVLWDLLIVEVLKFALTNSSTFQQNRNSKKFTETGNNRPDLSLVVKDYCVFRGRKRGLQQMATQRGN
ncbi:hypothetical protein BCR33DRAFT_484282 [Rhizoclosmatium globosum]|uniref:Uncharacterized protein n=1 Tax=Rhizoclosmatium globosum TaxID=329046 RepID=A0A1Y2BPN2_9FUNG|nr:hypothetical protein BCR33DRAFT_484282 [Rhizoclosmatium globosum]|eukprot:ORY36125.1 hypothetical protein BCR33DRAFT_484282 [Rhizoclosmatium globosum]